MIYTKVRGKAANEELARLWRRIGELYRELGIEERLTNLTLAMLCNVDKPHANYPTLKAKAAETRHLVPVMAKLLVEEDDGSDVSQHRIQAIQALCSFYTILESQPMFLPPSASNAVMKKPWKHCCCIMHGFMMMHLARINGCTIWFLNAITAGTLLTTADS